MTVTVKECFKGVEVTVKAKVTLCHQEQNLVTHDLSMVRHISRRTPKFHGRSKRLPFLYQVFVFPPIILWHVPLPRKLILDFLIKTFYNYNNSSIKTGKDA